MKKILITGARSGIIYPVIQKLKKDYFLYITVHTESELKRVKKMYQNDNVQCLKLDIMKDVDKVKKLDVDILVCNAAMAESGSLMEIEIDKVKNNFEVNVFSNLNLIQKIVNKMIKKGNGRIVIISSLAGRMPMPFLGSYAASKAALSSFGRTLYYESKLLSANIDFILIEPGLYKTGFNKLAFDKKYEFMGNDSFFKNQVEFIRKGENIFLKLFEKKNFRRITNKIYHGIVSGNPRFRYSSPLYQNLIVKIYNLFY